MEDVQRGEWPRHGAGRGRPGPVEARPRRSLTNQRGEGCGPLRAILSMGGAKAILGGIREAAIVKPTKNVTVSMNVWQRQEDGQIGLSINNGWFITTVNSKDSSARGHPNLYRKLQQLLAEAGKWQSRPDSGEDR